jgi:hypothetical protein
MVDEPRESQDAGGEDEDEDDSEARHVDAESLRRQLQEVARGEKVGLACVLCWCTLTDGRSRRSPTSTRETPGGWKTTRTRRWTSASRRPPSPSRRRWSVGTTSTASAWSAAFPSCMYRAALTSLSSPQASRRDEREHAQNTEWMKKQPTHASGATRATGGVSVTGHARAKAGGGSLTGIGKAAAASTKDRRPKPQGSMLATVSSRKSKFA